MKRQVAAVLLAVVALAASPAYAQVTGGIKVGVNFADIKYEDDEGEQEFDRRTGLAVGGFVDVPVAPAVSFQPEILYSQKGAKFTDDFDGTEFTLKYDVIQIPLLAKLNFGGDSAARGFIVVGPAFSFNTKANIEDEDGTEVDDLEDEVEKVDFSGIIGAGVQFGMGMVEVRYDHGFRNIDAEDLADIKTRTFSVLFGVGWGR